MKIKKNDFNHSTVTYDKNNIYINGIAKSPKMYKICYRLMYIIIAICLFIGFPTFPIGGFVFVILGIIALIAAFRWKKIYKNFINQNSNIYRNNNITKSHRYNPKASNYKMDTLEDIESIPVPTKEFSYYNCDFTESIEYVLQRKATEFKRSGNMDLAIACLRKSNEIMPFAPTDYINEYERLEQYLKKVGKFDEARTEKIKRESMMEERKKRLYSKNDILLTNHFTGIIEVPRCFAPYPECAKYHDRIYTSNGKGGYPDISILNNYYDSRKCICRLSAYPFTPGISSPSISDSKNLVQYSNRPFVDDRTPDEIENYKKQQQKLYKIQDEKKDRNDYDWICEHLPEIAPKSFGGYRNMKNQNSANYLKIVEAAKQKGYII